MQKHIYVEQKEIEEISREDLNSLAILTDLNLDETSNLIGKVHTTNLFIKTKEVLEQKFPQFEIDYDALTIIDTNRKDSIILQNSDKALMEIISRKNWSTNTFFMTEEEAASIKGKLSGVFTSATDIVDFSAFKYFTGITEIYGNVFQDCEKLETIVLPPNAKIISQGDSITFKNCINLKNVTLNKVTTDYDSVFVGCTSLKRIEFPEGTISISNFHTIDRPGCFNQCTSLKSIKIPSTLKYLGNISQDNGYDRYISPVFSETNLITIEGWDTSNIEIIGTACFCNNNSQTLKLNRLPSSVKQIGRRAFDNQQNIAFTELPEGLTHIGDKAFYNTKCNFTKLPESVTTIFYNGKLQPGGVPWANTTGTQTYPLYNSHYISWSGYGEKALGSTALSNSFLDCDNEGNIILKNHQTLSSKAFYNNKNIKTLLGADGIYSQVFYGCTNLKNVKEGTIKNATAVFYGCTGLTEITEDIWNLFTDTIGNETFRNCSNLTTIEIPETICKPEGNQVYDIFNGCSNLIEAIINNGGIFGSYGNSSGIFSGCNLTKLTIKNAGIWKKQGQSLWGGTIKEIILPKEFEEFYQNGVIATSRTHKINMNNIKYLNKSANSKNVTSGIPCLKFIEFNKLEYIGNQTFNSTNNGLKCIYLNQSSIPSWSGSPILHSNLTQLKFYIPQGMRDSYLADSNWDTISDRIIEVTPEQIESIKKEYYGVDFFGDKYYDTKRLLTLSSRIELQFEIWNQSNLLGSVSGNGQGGIWQFSQNQFRIFDNIIYATPTNTTSALYGNKHTLIVDNSKLEVNGTSVAHSNTQPFTSTKSFIIGGYYWFRNNTVVKASNATIYSLLWYEEDTLVQAWIGNENGGFNIYANEDIEPQENDRKFNLQDYYDNVEGGENIKNA